MSENHAEGINFRSRRWVRPEDLNAHGSLFGGSLLRWIDEEAAIYAILQLGNPRAVTKFISEIEFVSSAVQGDLIEMGLESLSLKPHQWVFFMLMLVVNSFGLMF